MRLVQFAAKYSEMSEENKETSPAQKKKAEYLNNRAAVMVGDQAGIFASFPGGNEEIRRQFLAFDAEKRKQVKKYTGFPEKKAICWRRFGNGILKDTVFGHG